MKQLTLDDPPVRQRESSAGWKSILVPLDGTETSPWILERSRRLLEQPGLSVVLLRVIPCAEARAEQVWYRADERHGSAGEPLVQAAARLRARSINVRSLLRFGDPHDEILHEIQEGGHDLVVMSTHARGFLSRLFFRGVTGGVIAASPVPVLVFCPLKGPDDALSSSERHQPAEFNRLLVLVDGHPEPEAILTTVDQICTAFRSEVHLLLAVPAGASSAVNLAAEEYLGILRRRMAQAGIFARSTLAAGSVVAAAVAAAGEHHLDSIALMTHSRSGLGQVLQGSTAQRLIRETGLPVFVRCNPLDRRSSNAYGEEHRQRWLD